MRIELTFFNSWNYKRTRITSKNIPLCKYNKFDMSFKYNATRSKQKTDILRYKTTNFLKNLFLLFGS